MAFPIRPLLDRVIIRVIPIEEYFRVDDYSQHIKLDHEGIKVLSDRGEVVSVSADVNGVSVGDIVVFDPDFAYDPIYLNPADKHRPDSGDASLPKYLEIRMPDLKGVYLA